MKRSDGTYDNSEKIVRDVQLYNETGDKHYLWDCYEELRHCIQSLLWKRLKGNPTPNFTENVQTITEKWMLDIITRKERGNPYYENFSPISYAHFMIVRYLPTDDAIWNKKVDAEDVVELYMPKDYSVGEEVDYTNDINDFDYDIIL